LGVIGLSDKPRHHARPGDGLGLIVHRKRVVRHRRRDEQTQRHDRDQRGDRTPPTRCCPHDVFLLTHFFLPSKRSRISRTSAGRSSFGLSQPTSKFFSQFFAHGR